MPAHKPIVGYADLICQPSLVGTSNATRAVMLQTESMTTLKAIGARVRELRLAQDIGQEELAAAIGVSRSTVAGIETGGDRGGIETMVAIADYFKVPMDWLLDRKIPPGSPPVGKLVYRPDQIAILRFWDSLTIDDQKVAVRMLNLPNPVEAARPARRKRASRR